MSLITYSYSPDARLDNQRAQDKHDDFLRQESMLKMISTELTTNTTKVVEAAVKTVVRQQVLPVLEDVTRTEVKAAIEDQIGRGLLEVVSQVSIFLPAFLGLGY